VADDQLYAEMCAFAGGSHQRVDSLVRCAQGAAARLGSGTTSVASDGLMDIGIPLFDTEDERMMIPGAIEAPDLGKDCPQFGFKDL